MLEQSIILTLMKAWHKPSYVSSMTLRLTFVIANSLILKTLLIASLAGVKCLLETIINCAYVMEGQRIINNVFSDFSL